MLSCHMFTAARVTATDAQQTTVHETKTPPSSIWQHAHTVGMVACLNTGLAAVAGSSEGVFTAGLRPQSQAW